MSASTVSASQRSTDPVAESLLRTGYIVDSRSDLVWFLGLPFLALACALAGQAWLPVVAIASVALWIDTPHQFVTLVRTYGVSEDRQRFWDQLLVGLIAIATLIAVGLWWAPLTLVLVSTLWNHQHQLMQLHGFARIYDFKARAGAPSTGRWDLTLAWLLYGNLFITSPLFSTFWIRELHRFGLPITASGVETVQLTSWMVVAGFGVAYVAHVLKSLSQGYSINPIKYLFILCNYSVLYYVSWHSSSLLVYGIANVMMHGGQYLVFIYLYMQRSASREGSDRGFVSWLVRPGHVLAYLLLLGAYSVVFQILSGRPLDELGFGVVRLASTYNEVPQVKMSAMSITTGRELLLVTLLNVPGMLHLYYDSFIWKVRDRSSQKGL